MVAEQSIIPKLSKKEYARLKQKLFTRYFKITGDYRKEEAEDCAHWVFQRWLRPEGLKTGQTAGQAVIDYIRSRTGNTSTKLNKIRQAMYYTPINTIEEISFETPDQDDFNYFVNRLIGRMRAIFVLSVKWNLTHEEIGEVLGICGTRVTQLWAKALKELEPYIEESGLQEKIPRDLIE